VTQPATLPPHLILQAAGVHPQAVAVALRLGDEQLDEQAARVVGVLDLLRVGPEGRGGGGVRCGPGPLRAARKSCLSGCLSAGGGDGLMGMGRGLMSGMQDRLVRRNRGRGRAEVQAWSCSKG